MATDYTLLSAPVVNDQQIRLSNSWTCKFPLNSERCERKVVSNGYPKKLVDNIINKKIFVLRMNAYSTYRNENHEPKSKCLPYNH